MAESKGKGAGGWRHSSHHKKYLEEMEALATGKKSSLGATVRCKKKSQLKDLGGHSGLRSPERRCRQRMSSGGG